MVNTRAFYGRGRIPLMVSTAIKEDVNRTMAGPTLGKPDETTLMLYTNCLKPMEEHNGAFLREKELFGKASVNLCTSWMKICRDLALSDARPKAVTAVKRQGGPIPEALKSIDAKRIKTMKESRELTAVKRKGGPIPEALKSIDAKRIKTMNESRELTAVKRKGGPIPKALKSIDASLKNSNMKKFGDSKVVTALRTAQRSGNEKETNWLIQENPGILTSGTYIRRLARDACLLTWDNSLVLANPNFNKRLERLELIRSSSSVIETIEGATAAASKALESGTTSIHSVLQPGFVEKAYVGITALAGGTDGIVVGQPVIVPRKAVRDNEKRKPGLIREDDVTVMFALQVGPPLMISILEGLTVPRLREVVQSYDSVATMKDQKEGGASGMGSIRVKVPVAKPGTDRTKPGKSYKLIHVADNLLRLYCTLSKKGKEELTVSEEYLEKEVQVQGLVDNYSIDDLAELLEEGAEIV